MAHDPYEEWMGMRMEALMKSTLFLALAGALTAALATSSAQAAMLVVAEADFLVVHGI